MLGHIAMNAHSIIALYSIVMFAQAQHTLMLYMLVCQVARAIIQEIPSIMLVVQETMQQMLSPMGVGQRQTWQEFCSPQNQMQQILEAHKV